MPAPTTTRSLGGSVTTGAPAGEGGLGDDQVLPAHPAALEQRDTGRPLRPADHVADAEQVALGAGALLDRQHHVAGLAERDRDGLDDDPATGGGALHHLRIDLP